MVGDARQPDSGRKERKRGMKKRTRENTHSQGGQGLHEKGNWLSAGILFCMVFSIAFLALYGYFRSNVEKSYTISRQPESYQNVRWLYQNTFSLYRDLYNKMNQCHADYEDIYLRDDESTDGYNYYEDWILDILADMEEDFCFLNDTYGYMARSSETGDYVTNMSEKEWEALEEDSYFLVTFVFDGAGNVTVGDSVAAQDQTALRRAAAQAPRDVVQFAEVFPQNFTNPVNCTVTFAISRQDWLEREDKFLFRFSTNRIYVGEEDRDIGWETVWSQGFQRQWYLTDSKAPKYLGYFSALLVLLGFLLPVSAKGRNLRTRFLWKLPLEGQAAVGLTLLALRPGLVETVAWVAQGEAFLFLQNHGVYGSLRRKCLIYGGNALVLTAYFLGFWYLGCCLKGIRELGLKQWLKEKWLFWRLVSLIKRKGKAVYDHFLHVQLTRGSSRAIRRLVIVNAVILSMICVFWLGGILLTVIYSVILYLLLKKYVSDLQMKYELLLRAVDGIAQGNLNASMEEDLGVFEPFKPQILKIQSGFKKAVEEEVKSQRMKAELITNVSHDLKTPLTAIITYVDLLKDPELTQEQRGEYLETLEKKSLRLRALIEDLFEVSKANSGSMPLNRIPVDLVSLVRQALFELKDLLQEAELDVRMDLPDGKIILSLDSQKTYRIYENLFANVAKYALKGTRVYVAVQQKEDGAVVTVKNISAAELTTDPSELTERFVRGDVSRNSEGNGLGLAIAAGFCQMQGGSLTIETDGDLFKATTVWRTGGGENSIT